MEEIKAVAKNVRGSAEKMRIPARVVVGMGVDEALPVLEYMEKSAAKDVYKVIRSAIANATHNYQKDAANLYVKSVVVGEGMKLKRFKPKSKGMASPITRKFSNITVVLGELSSKNAEVKTEKTKEVKAKKETKSKTSSKKANK